MGFLEEGSKSRRRPWRPGRRAATAFCAEGTAKAKAPGSGKRSVDSRAGNTKARSRAGVGATGQPDLKGRPRPPRQATSPLGRVCLRSSPSGVYVSATSSRRPSLLPALTRLEPALSALPVCRALRTPKVRELSITGGHRLPTRHTGLSRSPSA